MKRWNSFYICSGIAYQFPCSICCTSYALFKTFGIFPVDVLTDDYMNDNNQLDSSAYGSMDEMDDIPQGL